MGSVAEIMQREKKRRSIATYRDLVEEFLEDPVITLEDGEGLFAIAAALGLSRAEAEGAHLAYLRRHAERQDIEHVAALLGFDRRTFDTLLGDRVQPRRLQADSAEMTPPPCF